MSIDNLVFIDIETTGLDSRWHVPWEVGVIGYDGEVLFHEMWKPTNDEMHMAESMALSMNHFYERINSPAEAGLRRNDATYNAKTLASVLNKKVLCGAAVHFDAGMLDVFLRAHGQTPTWSHRLIDVQTYVAGAYGHEGPVSLSQTADRANVPYEKDKKHTALYDAWLAREVYSSVQSHHGRGLLAEVAFENLGRMPGVHSAPEMPVPPSMEASE